MSTGVYRTTTWALLDQAIVSGGNFLTNLVLIRTLAAPSYGAYALILNAILFLNNLHANMVTYPVCIRGARADAQGVGEVATGGLLATVLGTPVIAAVIIAACVYIHLPRLIPVVIAATLFWQIQETLRTVFVSRLAYKRALIGDAISYLAQVPALAAICWHYIPPLTVVFGVILVTSFAASVLQAMQITPTKSDRPILTSFFVELWRLGKWSTLAKVVAFFTFQAFPWLLEYTVGLAAVASFQSLFLLVALANPVLLSFNNLIIASIANRSRTAGVSPWAATVKQIRLAATLLGLYFSTLAIFGRQLMQVVYGAHSPYLTNSPLLRYFALAFGLEAIAMFGGAILAGLGETRLGFGAQACAMVTSVFVVFPWIIHSGLRAAVIGLSAVAATRAIAASCLAYRGLKRERLALPPLHVGLAVR
jgi:O-antigen/teichoic acid export membrane protein